MPKTKYMTMEDLVLILTLRILENDERLIEQCDTYKITNYYDILARLQKVKSHAPFFLKLVSQIQQALSENTTEAKKFMQSLDLIITAFDTYGKEQGINRNWKKLLNALHNKKLQYRAIKAFQDKTFGYDYFENTILITECANNPYASAQDILWYCIVNDEPIDSPMFKRGLKKFDEEFDEEAKKDKPDFMMICRGIWSVFQEQYIEANSSNVDTESDEFIELVSRYSNVAIDMRIRIAMLEKENKKLKTKLRTQKTAGLKKGITNVTNKTKTTKGNSKQR